MAHELGHVVHRHGMEQLISTSATGLLIGFILGDMTGLSVAGGIGAALIDTRFSRDAEREADRFAADAARRMGFDARSLVTLLDRVAGDDEMSRALRCSAHPLTAERKAALKPQPEETLRDAAHARRMAGHQVDVRRPTTRRSHLQPPLKTRQQGTKFGE